MADFLKDFLTDFLTFFERFLDRFFGQIFLTVATVHEYAEYLNRETAYLERKEKNLTIFFGRFELELPDLKKNSYYCLIIYS